MTTTARIWLVLGWAGFGLLPWHLPSDANWYDWVIGYSAQGPRTALGLAWSGGAWWLAPITLPLVIAAWPLVRYGREQANGMLAGAGIGGLALVVIQGFAIACGAGIGPFSPISSVRKGRVRRVWGRAQASCRRLS